MSQKLQKFLVMQTAFIGDVILATAVIEKIHAAFPEATIDFLLRKGNEGLLKGHPYLGKVYVFDKKGGKFKEMKRLIGEVRKERYDKVINLQRFFSSGFICAASGAKETIGYKKNPMSWAFSSKKDHVFSEVGDENILHEVGRNQALIADFTDPQAVRPKLYPTAENFQKVATYTAEPFVCMAPTSVWFTKQFPASRWVSLIDALPESLKIYILGAPADKAVCQQIIDQTKRKNALNLAGELNLLDSAALMSKSQLNYVNDSAPMHLASAVNAPTVAIYCSTVPAFGYGPLAEFSKVVEVRKPLACRPCGIHGHRNCPKKHFDCGHKINMDTLVDAYTEAVAFQQKNR
ncbi:glycosyltransferase family 9 protein [Persicobacter psychrovividus]|uniref:ADP-heptosyltransferase n=1 Tax=Persicobacter psychrovividus TaxID=387638 RepID=A0ABM7VDH6_9BACT|nr:ADP-heptosyltransferase [Persicobacter psychrovividus]